MYAFMQFQLLKNDTNYYFFFLQSTFYANAASVELVRNP